MNAKIVTLFMFASCLASCATTANAPKMTSTKLQRAHMDNVAASLVRACSVMGGRIVNQTQNMLECAKPMGSSGRELAYRALATERDSSNPDFHYQWTFSQSGDGIDVMLNANEWVEHQNAFGKTERSDLWDGYANDVMRAMDQNWNSPSRTD